MNIEACPKIELHLHLEGAAPLHFIRQLAAEKHEDIGGIFAANGDYKFTDFAHFLKVYEAATSIFTSPDDFYRLTCEVLQQSAEQGVIYTEVFVSPDFCGGCDLAAWQEYLAAIEQAAAQSEREFGIVAKGIVTCIRHFGPDQARKAARCAAETAGDFIVGFGMGGDELQGKQGDFAYSFDMAREAKLHLTTHAGEWGGAESVRQAIFDLNVERIGHGVRVINDPSLVDELVARQITLEVCPGSNVALGVYPALDAHPVNDLRSAGVKTTISTDDPPFFHTTLGQEYRQLADTFGWTSKDFTALNKTAAEAAFCSAETRQRLLERLEKT
jgi:adenosine deaminase